MIMYFSFSSEAIIKVELLTDLYKLENFFYISKNMGLNSKYSYQNSYFDKVIISPHFQS